MTTAAPAPRPTVFLHVGAPKTGTTFLQEILWQGKDVLAEEGVLLPGGRRATHFQATLDVRDVPAERRGVAPGAWQRIVNEATKWDGRVLITHELFAGATAEQAQRALQELDFADVHVIYTVRDLERQIPAEWQERIKHRKDDSLRAFAQEIIEGGQGGSWFSRVQDPADVLRRWGSELPPERVHLVTVPPAGSDPGLLWRRFCSVIGIDPGRYDTESARSNVSLGLHEAEFLRRVNTALGDRLSKPGLYPRFVKEILAHRVLAARSGKVRFGFDPALGEWVDRRARQMIEELKGEDWNVVGDLNDLLPGGSMPDAVHPDDVDEAAVADAGAHAAAALVTRLRQQTARAERSERRVAELERAQQSPGRQLLHNLRDTSVRRARSAYHASRSAAGRLPLPARPDSRSRRS